MKNSVVIEVRHQQYDLGKRCNTLVVPFEYHDAFPDQQLEIDEQSVLDALVSGVMNMIYQMESDPRVDNASVFRKTINQMEQIFTDASCEVLDHKKNHKSLHLNLTKKWFDMIASGEKHCEYRDIKPYWMKRIFENGFEPKFKTITFSNGYSKNRRQMVVELKSIDVGYGKRNWGAPVNKMVYRLHLGKIISKNF